MRFGRELRLEIDVYDDCEVKRGVEEDEGPLLPLSESVDVLASDDDGDGELEVRPDDCRYGS